MTVLETCSGFLSKVISSCQSPGTKVKSVGDHVLERAIPKLSKYIHEWVMGRLSLVIVTGGWGGLCYLQRGFCTIRVIGLGDFRGSFIL